jgi:hypothetical protein
MKSSRLKKVMAVLLLLYGAADLLIPGVCPYEVHLIADGLLGLNAYFTGERLPSHMSPLEPSDPDDDCYCCSTRIRPQSPPALGISESVHLKTATLKVEPLAGFSPHPYHPPRSS